MEVPQTPFTNAQLEILKLFSTEMNENDLQELKALIGKFYAEKATALADQVWEEKGLSQKNMDQWLHEKS